MLAGNRFFFLLLEYQSGLSINRAVRYRMIDWQKYLELALNY